MPPTPTDQRWCLSVPTYGFAMESVDAERGVLHGVAICTEGEAKGHGYMLDEEFIADVVEQGNAKKSGLKVRFGHPNMSSTALGTFLGRAKNLRLDRVGGAAVARADVYLSNEAKETPHGNLYNYVIGMAANEGDMCGMSIVFSPGECYQKAGPDGKVGADSPWFASLDKLIAADMVDDPAANPDGMFSAWSNATFAGQVTEFLDLHPHVFELVEANPAILEQFMARYRAYLQRKGATMTKPNGLTAAEIADETEITGATTEPADADEGTDAAEQAEPEAAEPTTDPTNDETPDAETPETEAPDTDAAEPVAEPTAEDADDGADECEADEAAVSEAETEDLDVPEVEQTIAKLGARFIEAFGEQGAVWFARGKTFEEAQKLHVAALEAENAELKKKLGASRGEDEPVSFQAEGETVDPKARKLKQNLGDNLARFAGGIKLPGEKAAN